MSKTLPARTPWFSCKTPPRRTGLYETRLVLCGTPSNLVVLARWKGGRWGRLALSWRDEWRGLTEQVK